MTRTISPRDFLQTVSGVTRADMRRSGQRSFRLATVDEDYDPESGDNPKVTFDGELNLSGKRYPHVNTYAPQPGDRVVMAPVGTGYVILGAIGGAPEELSPSVPRGLAAMGTNTSVVSNITSEQVVIVVEDCTFKDGRAYALELSFLMRADTNPAWAYTRIRRGSTTGGTELRQFRLKYLEPQSPNLGEYFYGKFLVKRNSGAGDLTIDLACTLARQSGTGTLTYIANSTNAVGQFAVTDVGAADDYPAAFPIT